MKEKPVLWVGSSLDDVRAFPAEARGIVGRELLRVQRGLLPHSWKPMANVGFGVYELRIRTSVSHRVFYIAKFEEAVYVLHAFEKRSRKTRKADLVLARARLLQVQKSRGGARKSP